MSWTCVEPGCWMHPNRGWLVRETPGTWRWFVLPGPDGTPAAVSPVGSQDDLPWNEAVELDEFGTVHGAMNAIDQSATTLQEAVVDHFASFEARLSYSESVRSGVQPDDAEREAWHRKEQVRDRILQGGLHQIRAERRAAMLRQLEVTHE